MATTTTSVKRITKAMRFEDIKSLLNGETPTYGSTVEDIVTFCNNELSLLAKKNAGDKKLTKTQEENEAYKVLILDFLRAQTEGVTCTDIQKGVPEFADFNNQKIAALMRALVTAGKATKAVVKGKALFTIA